MSGVHIDIVSKQHHHGHRASPTIGPLQLDIAPNQFVCLVGPSGCGKTTLLQMIAGLDRDYVGQIVGSTTRLNNTRLADTTIAYMFQNPRLLPWYSVRQNIELVFQGPVPTTLIDQLLVTMQLEPCQHDYPQRLSLGMQRRVAIIRAFAINPDLLLMDEPFVSLDAPAARQIRKLLRCLWQQRPHTVLFVTHDVREAIALADRLIFLSPSPMQTLADIAVDIPREQRDDEVAIDTFKTRLLSSHPEIHDLL
ncbi:MAG: ATP-binding cassette domain-containing protein [Methylomonas sp.]|nr:ATP-binding cassette domain-containing protein [Methylomonas sp.]PPD21978.1 MAG: ABC transporter [Methylomonas sp.]PPD25555.1 MAG: ABC transporter [Methylomonas sp.]PPD36465.1 MAG: ABC transporter [Methylomonas sp.]PPD39512.1 MAG: ABC transporter [Methylomonas sp.]